MPKETKPEPDRTPEEASQLAREVMKRMLQTPPKPHVAKKRTAKKSPPRKKS
jgi:hypothetical protein